MEMIVTLVRLVYHDAASIRLELEIAYAVKFYVLHYVGKHPFYKDGAYFARIVFLAAQPLGYVPDKMPQVKGGQGGHRDLRAGRDADACHCKGFSIVSDLCSI